MKKQLRDAWCEALRSGKYRQGRNSLVRPAGHGHPTYCCLGVLLVVTGEKENAYFPTADGNARLSPHQLSMVGLTLEEALLLTWKNDCAGMSFKQIADFIESRIPVEEDQCA